MTLRGLFLVILFALAAACAPPPAPNAVEPDPGQAPAAGAAAAEAAAATITAAAVRDHIFFLASDEMRGRDTPSPELEIAAEHLRDHFQALGLEPAGDDGGYFQRWPFHLQALDGEAVRMSVEGVQLRAPQYRKDFFAIPGRPESTAGVPVFLGAAEQVGELVASDVDGRIAVVYLPGMPGRDWQMALIRSQRLLGEAGVEAAVYVLDPQFGQDFVATIARNLEQPQRDRSMGLQGEPPAFFLRHEPGAELFRAAGEDLDALRRRTAAQAGPVELSALELRLAAPFNIVSEDYPPNVLAMLRGSDPVLRDEYVVITAHFDHVGVGQPDERGDSTYNGADDNASGTSALMEVARAFAALPEAPARSVIFLPVSGEEKGLLGSQYWTERPTVPLENVIMNINLDMVGRNHPDTVHVIGKEWSDLGPLVRRIAEERQAELRLTPTPDLWPEERLFFRSDQYNFVRHEIPALFFFTGLHEDYHRPSDTPDKVDPDKIARIAKLAFYTAHEVADRPERPQWTPEGIAEVRGLVGGGR